MLISYNWLQSYFDKKIPKPKDLVDVLVAHSFEVEGLEKNGKDYVLDVDVLPNRAHDCLSHFGMAKEVATLLNVAVGQPHLDVKTSKSVKKLEIDVKEPDLCKRYVGRRVEGIKVKKSLKKISDFLEVIGQKSINNIVDATNYVMFELGQPLHAFDADKVDGKITVRYAKKGERITTLDGQEGPLNENILIIADEKGPLAIAGIKGGKKAEVDENTENIILEAANFDQANIRKTSKKIGLRTESSLRFENDISSELAEKAIERLTSIVLEVAGGETGEIVDIYPRKPSVYTMGIYPKDVAKLVGIEIEEKDIVNILERMNFGVKKINPIKNVLKIAKDLKGAPYVMGASVTFDAPNAFDCSSFVSYVFSQSGVSIPRMSVDQYFYGEEIKEKDLEAGDLVFANSGVGKIHKESKEFMKGLKVKEGVDHCGIYIGNGEVIHATRKKECVVVEKLKNSEGFKNIVGYCRVVDEKDELLRVTVPAERLDIRIKEDLIEEIARIYGFEKIPSLLPQEILIPPKVNENVLYANLLKNILLGIGFSEVYSHSFDKKGDIELENPIAKDKKFLRTILLNGLDIMVQENLRFFKKVRIFEIGKVFKEEGENIKFAAVASNADYYEMKGIVETVLEKVGITDFYFDDHPDDRMAEIKVGNTDIGIVDRNAFEIDFEILVKLATEEMEYRPISKFPASKRDLAIFVPLKTKVIEVMDVVENTAGELLVDTDLFDIYENPEKGMKSFAFHLEFQSHEKTLSDKEINDLMDKIMDALDSNVEWEVRKG